MIFRVLREDGGSVFIEKGRLIRAPARSPLRVTEPDKSRVTYPDSMPFSRTGFFGIFPKQNKSEFPAAKQNCKRRLHLRKGEEPIFRTIRRVRRARAPPALPCQARPGEASERVAYRKGVQSTEAALGALLREWDRAGLPLPWHLFPKKPWPPPDGEGGQDGDAAPPDDDG